MDKFKQMCNDLFIYLSDLTSSVPTPPISSLVAPLSDTQSTRIKKWKNQYPHCWGHLQNQIMMARKARRCVFKKDCEMKQWMYRLWMLSKSSQVTALRNNTYRLKWRENRYMSSTKIKQYILYNIYIV